MTTADLIFWDRAAMAAVVAIVRARPLDAMADTKTVARVAAQLSDELLEERRARTAEDKPS